MKTYQGEAINYPKLKSLWTGIDKLCPYLENLIFITSLLLTYAIMFIILYSIAILVMGLF